MHRTALAFLLVNQVLELPGVVLTHDPSGTSGCFSTLSGCQRPLPASSGVVSSPLLSVEGRRDTEDYSFPGLRILPGLLAGSFLSVLWASLCENQVMSAVGMSLISATELLKQ